MPAAFWPYAHAVFSVVPTLSLFVWVSFLCMVRVPAFGFQADGHARPQAPGLFWVAQMDATVAHRELRVTESLQKQG